MIFLVLASSCEKEEAVHGTVAADDFVEEMQRIDTLGCPENLLDRFSYAYGSLFASSLESLSQNINSEYFV